MKKYTVIVYYPEFACHDPLMTYAAYVEAEDALKARKLGAAEAQRAQPNEYRGKLVDWIPLAVLEGHQHTICFAWQTPAWCG